MFVRSVMPVLGLRANQIAELTDTPYLQMVLKRGWLERVNKTDAKDAGVLDQIEPAVDPDIANVTS